jgi:rRNA processing protein Krr1/Pno1
MVKVDHKPKPWYGVIRYIGSMPDRPGTFAGVEMEEVVEGGHSGKFNGKRYFTCEDGYGLILPLSALKPDDRFVDPPSLKGGPSSAAGDDVERDKHRPPPTSPSSATPRRPSDPLSPGSASPKTSPSVSFVEAADGLAASSGGTLLFVCPGDVAGFIIGKDGKNLRDVESKTGTVIKVEKNELDKTANTHVAIIGKEEDCCKKALVLIVQNIRRKTALHTATTEVMEIPNQHCGRVIGKKGANVQMIQSLTGTRINVQRQKGLEALLGLPATCEITGSAEQIQKAKEMIEMSVEGSDIAEAALIAAFMVRFMKELQDEGYTFGSK